MMPIATGLALALLTGLTARLASLDRDRSFYPTLTIVIASYYVLFAVMGGSERALLIETIALVVFACLAVAGFRSSLWVVAAALVGHGAFDAVHGKLISNPGVPAWWALFCLAFDVFLAGFLSWLLYTRRLPPRLISPDARAEVTGR